MRKHLFKRGRKSKKDGAYYIHITPKGMAFLSIVEAGILKKDEFELFDTFWEKFENRLREVKKDEPETGDRQGDVKDAH